MQFSPFFVFRPWPKRIFLHFFAFGHGRNAVFTVFYSSATAETLFLLFFTLRARPKVDFLRFFAFGRARNAVFVVFCSSEPSESHFFCFLLIRALGKPFFSVFCSSETSESHFLLFSAHPRPRKAVSLPPPPQRNSDFTDYIAKERKISHIKK